MLEREPRGHLSFLNYIDRVEAAMAAATNEVRWISSLLRMSSLWGDILSNCSSGDELRRLPLREKPSSNCCLVRTFTNPVCILWYPSELSNSWTICFVIRSHIWISVTTRFVGVQAMPVVSIEAAWLPGQRISTAQSRTGPLTGWVLFHAQRREKHELQSG